MAREVSNQAAELGAQERVIELRLSYQGSAFRGWQVQPKLRTVQGTLQELLRKVLAEPELKISGGSRTDSGVHAHDQHVSFTTKNSMPCEGLRRLCCHLLPSDLQVWSVEEKPLNFSARHHAKAKHYTYFTLNRRDVPPFIAPYVWHHGVRLDEHAMDRASQELLGSRCFKALQSSRDFRENTETKIYAARVWRVGDLLAFDVLGRNFLYLMVRNMMGALLKVGWGEWKPEKLAEQLESGDRRKMGLTMPALGLHLFESYYEEPPYSWSSESLRFAEFLQRGAELRS